MLRHTALWICWIPLIHCSVCPVRTGPVFISENISPLLNKGVRCYEHCAERNCTGVLLHSTFCIALDLNNNFEYINETNFIRKHCLQDITQPIVVSSFKSRAFKDYNKKIHTNDEYHCLSKCINEKSFPCSSIMYYGDKKDCLMVSNTSEIEKQSYETNGLTGSHMQKVSISNNQQCTKSFRQIKWNDLKIKGEAKLYNGSEGLDKCVSLCVDCDFVLFTEIYSECFIIQSHPLGQKMEFLNEEYQVLENLCRQPATECSTKNSIYISYKGEEEQFKKQCLNSCLFDDTCMFAYKHEGKCLKTTVVQQLPIIIERKCTEIDDMDFAILYEESPGCMIGEPLMEQSGLDLVTCMFLCVTHPTKSCESIAFSSGICLLLNDVAQLKNSSNACQHFTLNIISYEKHNTSSEEIAGPSSMLVRETQGIPMKKKSRNKSETPLKKTHLVGKRKQAKISEKNIKNFDVANITVETICNYNNVVVKISSREPIYGELFPRNGHKMCSIAIKGERVAQLQLPLNGTRCAMRQDGFIYHTIIVLKQNTINSIPVITENDGMYRISCDYSNQITNITAKRVLRLRDSMFRNVSLRGNITYDSTVKMELRSKREETLKSVVLGQHIDLVFRAEQRLSTGYHIRNCIATNEDGSENIILIEEGCATRTAKEYVIREDIKKSKEGFIIPFRAFKFKNGDEVKITCKLDFCQNCLQAFCGKDAIRQRRYLTTQNSSKDVHALMVVKESYDSEGYFCISQINLIIVIVTGTYIVFFLIYILTRIIRKHGTL